MAASPPPSPIHQQALRHAGLKNTPIRLALLEILAKQTEPIGVHEMVELLPSGMADKVTVYRAIESFVKHGLAKPVNLRHGHMDYESALLPDHHHIVCTSCGKTEDFDSCEIEPLIKRVLKKHPEFARIQDHALELFGTCARCVKKSAL